MAAQDPVSIDAVELTGDLADDGTRHSDDGSPPSYLSQLIDNDTGSGVLKPGKGGTDGDALRIEYANGGLPSPGDTISIWLTAVHQIDDGIEIQAYTDANSVTATAKIIIAAPISTGENIYTLTSGFIAELGDVGGGNFAVRFQPQAQEAGDVQVSEVDADLSAAPAAVGNKYQKLI